MDILNRVTFSFWLFENFTISNMIWTFGFLVAGIYFTRLTYKAWASYRSLPTSEDVKAERLLSLGRVVSQLDSLGIVTAGMVVGIAAAAAPHTSSINYSPRQAVILLALLSIPVLKMTQALILERIYKVATQTLKKQRSNE